VVKYTSMKKGFIKKRQDLRNLRLELETNVLTVWSKPPHTPFYISPEFFHDLPAGFLPPKADLRDTTARKQLRKDLNKLMKHKQKMKEFNDYLYKRDVFALAGCIYQYRTKNQFLPWHDHETIIKGALKLAITKLDEKIDACQDPKEKEQLKMERDLLKNDRDKEKIVRELVVHLKRINNLWEEIAELEKKFDKFLEIEMLNANVPIERFQQLKYELLTREDKIYKPEVKALFLNFKNFNKIKGLGKLISDKRYVFKKTEEAIEKGCKQEFGFTPPFKELYRDAIISNLTRSHQEALGYTKPDKTDRLAYLEWRMHDPDPKKRPSMREVYKELRAIHKNK